MQAIRHNYLSPPPFLFLTDDHRLLVEPSCAAALTPLYQPHFLTEAGITLTSLQGPVVVIVCGGSGVSLGQISSWREKVGL